MKKITSLSLILSSCLLAAVPNHLDFQGLAIDSIGNKVSNTNIAVKFEVINSSDVVVFTDTNESVTTSSNAIFNLKIGNTTQFSDINWSNDTYSLQISTDYNLTDGVSYTLLGSQGFSSIPYALTAKIADTATTALVAETANGVTGLDINTLVTKDSNGLIDIASFKLTSGASDGKILVSDENGTASWGTFISQELNSQNTTVDNTKNANAWGSSTISNGLFSTAYGASTQAIGDYSTSYGDRTIASGSRSTAWGLVTLATGIAATSFGGESNASGDYSTAFGGLTKSIGSYSTTFGFQTYASNNFSTAFGSGTRATSSTTTAFGLNTEAFGINSTAFGEDTNATGQNSVVWGDTSKATGVTSTAFGKSTIASGQYSTSWGDIS